MNPSDDNLDGLRPYDLTARLLIRDAELKVHADNRRELCILAETLLRDLHARGIAPRVIVEGHGAYRRIRIKRYLDDVCRELQIKL